MEEARILDMDFPFMKESFIVLFLPILQDVVDEYVGLWNLHKVKMINKNRCKKTRHVHAKYFQEYEWLKEYVFETICTCLKAQGH
jgi:hypothetical protein